MRTLEDRINEQDARCCAALERIGESSEFLAMVAEIELLKSRRNLYQGADTE